MERPCQRCGRANSAEAKFCLQCGAMLETAAPESADPMVGRILADRYRITRVLGEGGMGKVYLAEQKMGTATRKVAVKTLHKELSSDPQLIARFQRECETVIELTHPNTIGFYDFGDLPDGTLYIVMEYIEGESLARVLQRGAIDPARADRILIQICGSLHEAHQRGIVHRDLKPENVLLTSRGGQSDFVKVLDFGIAKRNEAEDESKARLTKQGMVLGTPPYMSPEQFSGQALDARSDIYSLGIMTYEMLTGRLPFEANTPWEWATQHLTAQPRPLESFPVAAALSDSKKRTVMRALAKARDHRQGSALEFLQEFTGLGAGDAPWTVAASGAMAGGSLGPPSVEPRPPVGTPGPLPRTGPIVGTEPTAAVPSAPQPVATATPHHGAPAASSPGPAGWQTPPPAVWQTPPGPAPGAGGFGGAPPPQASTGSFGDGPAGVPIPGASGVGRVVAIAAVALLVLGGGGAGAFYYLTRPAVVATTVDPGRDPTHGTWPAPPARSDDAGPLVQAPKDSGAALTKPPLLQVPTTASADAATLAVAAPDAGASDPSPPPPADPPGGDEPPVGAEPTAREPSAEEVRQAEAHVRRGADALSRSDLEGAARALQAAQRMVGRRHPALRPLRADLDRRAGNKVGILLQQGNCPGAQALFQLLSAVGADGGSRGHFTDWCRRPR